MSILIISGTNRANSVSQKIAKLYQSKLKTLNTDSEILNLSDLPKDFIFSALYENGGKHPEFNPLREKVMKYQKFVFIVAEYNGSFPGVLKAFIDGLKYPDSFKSKKAALVGLSSGVQGGALALSHLTDILSYLGTNVLGERVKIYRVEENFKNDELINKTFDQLLDAQVKNFIEF